MNATACPTRATTIIANRAGTRAWVSLWNGSAVAELDLGKGKVTRRIELWHSADPVAPGTHPTTMLLNRSEDTLYVAMPNAATAQSDGVAAVDLKEGVPQRCYRPALDSNDEPGSASIAIALSNNEKHLYAAVASLNAVVVFETKPVDETSDVAVMELPIGFVPTEWYPSALAFAGNDLLIASAKGDSSRPNNGNCAQALIDSGSVPA